MLCYTTLHYTTLQSIMRTKLISDFNPWCILYFITENNMSYTQSIPYTGHHGGIVVGKKGAAIIGLQQEFGCKITSKKPEPDNRRPVPYFLIEGHDLNKVCLAAIRVLTLINTSLSRSENKLRKENDELKSGGDGGGGGGDGGSRVVRRSLIADPANPAAKVEN